MRIYNLNNTVNRTCRCGGWLKHWQNLSGVRTHYYCSEAYCSRTAVAGGHVQKEGSPDRNWYIIPLCRLHYSQIGESLEISIGTKFALADIKETCER